MGNIKDKLVGKAKQAVAEINGDGKLAEEGKQQVNKQQVKKGESEPASKPFGNLDKLT